MVKQVKIHRGSGNVFRDLEFTPAEAKALLLPAQLLSEIKAAMGKLTQAQAARLFGVTQRRLKEVLQGGLDTHSLDDLIGMLAKAGKHVEIRVETPPQRRSRTTATTRRIRAQ